MNVDDCLSIAKADNGYIVYLQDSPNGLLKARFDGTDKLHVFTDFNDLSAFLRRILVGDVEEWEEV